MGKAKFTNSGVLTQTKFPKRILFVADPLYKIYLCIIRMITTIIAFRCNQRKNRNDKQLFVHTGRFTKKRIEGLF